MRNGLKPGVDFPGLHVKFFCVDEVGRFLLHRRGEQCRDDKGCWDFGGGKVEYGEKIHAAFLRELREEYGTKPTWLIGPLSPLEATPEMGWGEHWLTFPFIVGVNPSQVSLPEKKQGKVIEMGWFRLNELPSPMWSYWPLVIETWGETLSRYGKLEPDYLRSHSR